MKSRGPDDSMVFSASGVTDFFRRTGSVKNPRMSIKSLKSSVKSKKSNAIDPNDSLAFSASLANPRQSMKSSYKSKKIDPDDSLAFSASQATDFFNRTKSLTKTAGSAVRKSSLKRSSNVSNGRANGGSFKRKNTKQGEKIVDF